MPFLAAASGSITLMALVADSRIVAFSSSRSLSSAGTAALFAPCASSCRIELIATLRTSGLESAKAFTTAGTAILA
jgi:hypothetical protein